MIIYIQETTIAEQKKEKQRVLIEKAPFVEIKIHDGDAIPKDTVLKINAMGLINS